MIGWKRLWQLNARAAAGLCLLVAMAMSATSSAQAAPLDDRLDARVLLHRNAPRGMEYVPLATATAINGSRRNALNVDVHIKAELDGTAIDNVYANVLPLDFNNNGRFEYLHYNGYNFIQAFNSSGRRVWRITNPAGRKNSVTAATHRDGAAILELRGQEKPAGQDVLHCWAEGSQRLLIARRGITGAELRRAKLDGTATSSGSVCYISVYRMQSTGKPIILVAHNQPGGNTRCDGKNYVDYWTRVVAFDLQLNRLWQTDTCHAGHQTAGVDENGDGLTEYFFVGKYALDENGKIRCTLQGWNSKDHVDAIRVGQLDPAKPGLQAVAVGQTGMAAFAANDCRRLWSVGSSLVKNGQELALAQFDPAPAPLSILVTQRGSEPKPTSYVVSAQGKLLRNLKRRIVPLQNAEFDGDRRTDEILSMWGTVDDGFGRQLLSRNWYWNLKGTQVKETGRQDYDRWAPFPVLFDVDSDGRDEMIVWGQSLLVVGKLR